MRLIQIYDQVIQHLKKGETDRSFVFKFKVNQAQFDLLKSDLENFASYEEYEGLITTYLLGYDLEFFLMKKLVPKKTMEVLDYVPEGVPTTPLESLVILPTSDEPEKLLNNQETQSEE